MSEVNLKFDGKRNFVVSSSESLPSSPASCVNSRPVRKRKRRHVPHSQRSTEFVEKRNGRERKRVDDLNGAFECLKDRVPFIPRRNVRTSKMKILTNAISYIQHLTTLLNDSEALSDPHGPASVSDSTSLIGEDDTSSLSASSLVSRTEIEVKITVLFCRNFSWRRCGWVGWGFLLTVPLCNNTISCKLFIYTSCF